MKFLVKEIFFDVDDSNYEDITLEEYIERLKEQYIELYDLEIKDHEITNIEEYTLEATEWNI